MLQYAFDHKILIMVLPAHSSHLTQPLDVGLFGPLQHNYGILVGDWAREGCPALTKADFLPLLRVARDQTYTTKNVKSAWTAAGLVPYNRRIVLDKLQIPEHPTTTQHLSTIPSTPKTVSELRRLQIFGEQLVSSEGCSEQISQVLRMLGKVAVQGQVQYAIEKHEVGILKSRLAIKKKHHKSKCKLQASPGKKARLMDQEQIDRALVRWELKQAKSKEKLAKRRRRKRPPKAKTAKSVASAEESEVYSNSGMSFIIVFT